MSNYVTLLGGEAIERAASSMRASAERIASAANVISESVDRFIRAAEELRLSGIAVIEGEHLTPEQIARRANIVTLAELILAAQRETLKEKSRG